MNDREDERPQTGLRTKEQAAAWLQVPESWVTQKVSARAIPFTRVGKHVRFSVDHLEAIAANGEEAPPEYGMQLAKLRREKQLTGEK
ncbi:helix-turn-helix domain-containing protein [Salininema proteolyticum]|uniref:Helix-turn-helix domain-containing protein n=1 Tax=Salininema proteolyticum TaxID=1607685 RepID=A0ABV8TX62_9ACTN